MKKIEDKDWFKKLKKEEQKMKLAERKIDKTLKHELQLKNKKWKKEERLNRLVKMKIERT